MTGVKTSAIFTRSEASSALSRSVKNCFLIMASTTSQWIDGSLISTTGTGPCHCPKKQTALLLTCCPHSRRQGTRRRPLDPMNKRDRETPMSYIVSVLRLSFKSFLTKNYKRKIYNINFVTLEATKACPCISPSGVNPISTAWASQQLLWRHHHRSNIK